MGEKDEGYVPLRNFAVLLLATGLVVGLLLLVFTSLSQWWFQTVSGLSQELGQLAMFSAQIIVFMPGLTVHFSFEKSVLVAHRYTTPILPLEP